MADRLMVQIDGLFEEIVGRDCQAEAVARDFGQEAVTLWDFVGHSSHKFRL